MRIVIVEDQTMLRESLGNAIDSQPDMETVGLLGSASDVADMVERKNVDLVLMDVCTDNDSSGIAATRILKESYPQVKVVIMTGMPDITFVRQARDAGADSFVYKNIGTDELLSVLRFTSNGYNIFPGVSVTGEGSSVFMALTDDEIEIVKLVCKSKSRKEIAQMLYISKGTLKRRINEILAKTGYDSILKLAIDAVSSGHIVPNIK